MDFTTIGTIGSYLKQKNMKFAANYKMKTGQKLTDANGNLDFAESGTSDQVDTKKRSDREIASARIASIKQKLSNGQKLSNEELSYLRSREPKTYKRAKHADEAREELKGELRKAKTKQEAKQAVTQAMIKASAQASADIADSKSNSDSSTSTDGTEKNLSSFSGEVDGLAKALNTTFAENWGYTEENNVDLTNFHNSGQKNFDETENFNVEKNLDVEENNFSDGLSYFNQSTNLSKNLSVRSQNKGRDSPQNIMEEFIMTIRALEATWAEFTNSKEYAELPDNKREEEILNLIGDKTKKNRYKQIDKPKTTTLNAVTAYRNSMNFFPHIEET